MLPNKVSLSLQSSPGRLITIANVEGGLTQDITSSDVSSIKWVQCEDALSITSASIPNILGFVRQIYLHSFRVAIARKVPYSDQDSEDRAFQKAQQKPSRNGLIRTTKWNTTTTQAVPSTRSTPVDQFRSEEELEILTRSQSTRFYFIGRGDEHA